MPDDSEEHSRPEEGDTIIHEEERTVVRMGQAPAPEPVKPVAPDKPALVAVAGPLAGQTINLELQEGASFVLGRGADCQLVLDDGSVSRSHAQITRRGKLHSISDLGSSNGTLVDGQLIFKDHVLKNEALVKVGIYEFVFVDPTLSAADIPSTLPVPYTPQPKPQVYEPSVQPPAPMPPAPTTSPLFIVLIIMAIGAVALLIAGIKKISKDYPTGTAVQRVWSGFFGGGNEPKLAYPLLEVHTSPIPGEIYFQNELLGISPQEKKFVDGIMPDTPLELRAEFNLKGVEEKVVVKKMISVGRNQEVLQVDLEAPIGQIFVKKIPDRTQVLLEYKRDDAAPDAELTLRQPKVDYKEPLYVPFGEYRFELRRDEKFLYRRKFVVNAANLRREFDVREEDMTFAPLDLTSTPSEAEVFLDGVDLNRKTPLKDFHLSFGSHTILLRKENHQDYILENLPNPVQVNEPLSFDVKLPITSVGQLIVQAKGEYDKGVWRQSERTLYQALRASPPPTPAETAEIQHWLGQNYLKLKDFKQALIYFRKAKGFADADGKTPFADSSKLGEARVYFDKGDRLEALRLSVEVFFGAKDLTVKSGAEEIFHKLSPARSTLYIDTDPPGATIFLESRRVQMKSATGKQIPAVTPMIIPDLPVGNFALLLTKPGYMDHKEVLRLEVSDLKALRIKLKPR